MEEQAANAGLKRFPFKDPEQFGDIHAVAARAGIELAGEENHPHCCGQRMETEPEFMGQDHARCGQCKTVLINAASPYVNGGRVFDRETRKAYGDRMWTFYRRAENLYPKPELRENWQNG